MWDKWNYIPFGWRNAKRQTSNFERQTAMRTEYAADRGSFGVGRLAFSVGVKPRAAPVARSCAMNEHIQTTLRFVGDWPWWAGCGAALLLGGVAWFLYRRDALPQSGGCARCCRRCRALAVMMIVLMLSGPVLHHRKVIGQLSRLLLFVDGSTSMELTDPSMDLGRKILIAATARPARRGCRARWICRTPARRSPTRRPPRSAARSDAGIDTAEWNELVNEFAAEAERSARACSRKAAVRRTRRCVSRERIARAARRISRSARSKQIDDAHPRGRRISQATRRRCGPLAARDRGRVSTQDNRPNWPARRLAAESRAGEVRRAAALAAAPGAAARRRRAATARAARGNLRRAASVASTVGRAERLWQPTARDSALPRTAKTDGETSPISPRALKTGAAGRRRGSAARSCFSATASTTTASRRSKWREMLGGAADARLHRRLRQPDAPARSRGRQGRKRRTRSSSRIACAGRSAEGRHARGQPFTLSDEGRREGAVGAAASSPRASNVRRGPVRFSGRSEIVEGAARRRRRERVAESRRSARTEGRASRRHRRRQRSPPTTTAALRVRAVTQKRKHPAPRWPPALGDALPAQPLRARRAVGGQRRHRRHDRGRGGLCARRQARHIPDRSGAARRLRPHHLRRSPRAAVEGRGAAVAPRFRRRSAAARSSSSTARAGASRNTRTRRSVRSFPSNGKRAGLRDGIARLMLTERAASRSRRSLLAPDRAQNADCGHPCSRRTGCPAPRPLPGAETLVEAEVSGQRLPAWSIAPSARARCFTRPSTTPGAGATKSPTSITSSTGIRSRTGSPSCLSRCATNSSRSTPARSPTSPATPRISACACAMARASRSRTPPSMRCSIATANASRPSASHADENAGGLYRGKTAALEPGDYEVGVESAAIQTRDAKARTQFKVEPRETGELTMLNLNEDLLRQMSAASGGQYSARGKHRPTRRLPRPAQPGQGDRERHRPVAKLLVVHSADRVADDRVDRAQTGRDAVRLISDAQGQRVAFTRMKRCVAPFMFTMSRISTVFVPGVALSPPT